jgi:hypothetical protein
MNCKRSLAQKLSRHNCHAWIIIFVTNNILYDVDVKQKPNEDATNLPLP